MSSPSCFPLASNLASLLSKGVSHEDAPIAADFSDLEDAGESVFIPRGCARRARAALPSPAATSPDRTLRHPVGTVVEEGSLEREGAMRRKPSVVSHHVAGFESEARLAAGISASAPRPTFLARHLEGLDDWFDLSEG